MTHISFANHAQFAKGAELVAFYRGNRKRIIERAQKQAVVEVYNELDEDTWYKALRGDPTWDEAVRVLQDIYDDAWSFPENHLPPEPTEDLREWMKDWADAAWWHAAIDPESEIVAVGTLKNWFVKSPLTHVTDEELVLTREQARDTARYLAAREAARGIGKQVTISDGPPPEKKPSVLDARQFMVTADTVYLTAEAIRDTRTYQRFKAEAARDNKQLKPIRTWADLPQAERDQLEASLKDA